jgi:cytochrome P450
VFTPNAVKKLEPMVREVIATYLDTLDPSGFDVVQDFSALFPCEIITRMLGVPEEHRQQVRLWLDVSLHREPGQVGTSEEGFQAGVESGLMYYNLIQERRANPQDDMISRLIEVEVERDDGTVTKLDDVEITGFASLLGGAGAETVTKLIGNAAVTFYENPDQWQKLLDDRSKVPQAVEELLRYQAPAQYMVRWCTKDVELHGTTIPANSPVFLIPGSANRDERAFEDPDVFDIERPRDQAIHVGLGYGIHSCLGAALARMESRIAMEMMLDFMPRYEVDMSCCKRVAMTNVAGWSSVPAKVLS